LTINVFRPQSAKGSGKHKKKLPVAVYIPGGAFNRGAARMYNAPSMLAHSPEPFVVVSMQYRLGVLGGMNTELTADEGLLNLAIRDIYTSLEWVQENIAAFGGDPKDVTVLGASAGAHAVS
jgi:triacylglycerol lipase